MIRSTSPLKRFAVLFVLACVFAAGAPTAAADELDDKRAEAERIARDLEAEGQRLSLLAERYNLARLQADEVEAKVAAAATDLARLEGHVERARAEVRLHALAAYLRGGSFPTPDARGTDLDPSRFEQYVQAVIGGRQEAIEELRSAIDDAGRKRAELEATRSSAHAALAEVDQARQAAAAADAAQRSTLARVRGEMATLVQAEAERRAQVEARQAETALARQPARQVAAPPSAAGPAPAVAGRNPTTSTTRRSQPSPANDGPSGPAPPPASGAAAAVEEAKRQLGKPYQWGGSGPDTFDCSGLTAWAWRAGGRRLPHSSQAQYSATTRVSIDQIAPGDLVFFGSPIHHVGIYVGSGQMIEAPNTGNNVRYGSIHRKDRVGIGRVN